MNGLQHSGIPLGGLGTGSVELRRDGYFHEWQIMNNFPWGNGPEVSLPLETGYFGLQVRGPGLNRSAILGECPGANDWLNNPYELPWLEHPAIEPEIRFPFTQLTFRFDSFPVEASLLAFSPFIPHDAKNSGLPLSYFTFSLRNPTDQALEVTLFGGFRNIVGYSCPDLPSIMDFKDESRYARVVFRRDGAPEGTTSDGSMTLGVFGPGNASYQFHPRNSRDVWEPLRETGHLENADFGDYSGSIGNVGAYRWGKVRLSLGFGLLGRTLELKPGATETVTFVLAWHFPHMEEREYQEKGTKGSCIGHQYTNWFQDAAAVCAYGVERYEELQRRTGRFFESYYRSAFPEWVLQAISAQLTTLIKASWWDRHSRFGIWEGLGCCGLQTTDITYYGSFPIAQFFPEIQESQMRLTVQNIDHPGKIPHLMPGTFTCCEVDHRNRIDLIPQYILLVWRDFLWSGNREYLVEMWPRIKEALDFSASFDTDGDGLPNNAGPDQTYDMFPLKGTSALVGFIYAAALKAASQLAEALGETSYAAEMKAKFAAAMQKLEEQLWNGTYYRLCHDAATGERNEGVMVDQTNGDWFIRQTAGEGLLPGERVRSALMSVLKYCRAPRRYVANCAWPCGDGIPMDRHTVDQANWPWSGVEYTLAAYLVLMEMKEEGLAVARDVWERYERTGLRFNHIECGQHYYRAMSAWAIYLALTGFHYNCIEEKLSLSAAPETGSYLVVTPHGWGEVIVSEKEIKLMVREGEIGFRRLRLKGFGNESVYMIAVDGKSIGAETSVGEGFIEITFKEMVVLSAEQHISIL